jgi:hypothetical protein
LGVQKVGSGVDFLITLWFTLAFENLGLGIVFIYPYSSSSSPELDDESMSEESKLEAVVIAYVSFAGSFLWLSVVLYFFVEIVTPELAP